MTPLSYDLYLYQFVWLSLNYDLYLYQCVWLFVSISISLCVWMTPLNYDLYLCVNDYDSLSLSVLYVCVYGWLL